MSNDPASSAGPPLVPVRNSSIGHNDQNLTGRSVIKKEDKENRKSRKQEKESPELIALNSPSSPSSLSESKSSEALKTERQERLERSLPSALSRNVSTERERERNEPKSDRIADNPADSSQSSLTFHGSRGSEKSERLRAQRKEERKNSRVDAKLRDQSKADEKENNEQIEKVASLIEEIGLVLPGFSQLWRQAGDKAQNDTIAALIAKLNSYNNILSLSEPNEKSPSNLTKRRNHSSENPSWRQTGVLGSSTKEVPPRFSNKRSSHNLDPRDSRHQTLDITIDEQKMSPPTDLKSGLTAMNSLNNYLIIKANSMVSVERESASPPISNADIILSKRRDLKVKGTAKQFNLVDTKTLFRSEKTPSSQCIKLHFECASDFQLVMHGAVLEIDTLNKDMLGNVPLNKNFDKNKLKQRCLTSASSLINTMLQLVKELDIDKRDQFKVILRLMKDLELKKEPEPGEVDTKLLKIGLFKNLLICQLQRRILKVSNAISGAISQSVTNCLEMAQTNGEKDLSTILHTFCLFSSLSKLIVMALNDFESICMLIAFEPEKSDMKLKAEETQRRKAKVKNLWNLNQTHSDEDIYRPATIEELIVRGTCLQTVDMFYIDTLVTTALYLGEPPITFLEILLERFFPPSNKFPKDVENQFRIKALKLLRVYLTKNYYHIDSQLQFMIFNFCETKLPRAINNQAHIDSVKDKLKLKENFEIPSDERKLSKILVFNETKPYDILQFYDQDVAEQLTILDIDIFKKIQHYELLGQAWSKPKLQFLATNVAELITRPNKISFWVATCILLQQSLKTRAKTIIHFIQIAQKLDELKSYNTMMGVLAGLNSSAISRLHQSNAQIDKNSKRIFEELNAKVNPEKAFKNLRNIMEFCGRPCLPYIGIYLTDLTFIDEGNEDSIIPEGATEKMPNFPKQQMVCRAIANLMQFQQNIAGEYGLTVKHPLHSFLVELPALSENDLWELSLEREPRVNQ